MSVDLTPEERARIVAERADVKYGPFASLHEAYGVLAEEVWELGHAITEDNRQAVFNMSHLWDIMLSNLRANNAAGCIVAVGYFQAMAKDIAMMPHTPEPIRSEAIDVIAVCDRIIAQWGVK